MFTSTSSRGSLILINGGWCLVLLLVYFVGLPQPAGEKPTMGFGLLLLLLIPSLALLRIQYRTYNKQLNAEKLLAQALADVERRRVELERSLKEKSGHAPVLATVLGGSGAELQKDELILMSVQDEPIYGML